MNHKLPDISVIVPFFNSSDKLSSIYKTLKSQSIENWELILVDDGSLDQKLLGEYIENINDDRLVFIPLPINLGGGWARNYGIQASKAKFIAFLDSDDLWLEDKLKISLNEMESNKGDFFFSSINNVNLTTGESEIFDLHYSGEDLSEYIFVKNGKVQTSSIVILADLAKDVMFNPALPRHQDYDFVLRAKVLAKNIIYYPTPLTIWTISDIKSVCKGATFWSSYSWLSQYKKYMTHDAYCSYYANELFTIARNNKRLFHYIFVLILTSNLSTTSKILKRIIFKILKKVNYVRQ